MHVLPMLWPMRVEPALASCFWGSLRASKRTQSKHMPTFLVTIQGAHRQADLELPGDVPIHDLIPLLREMCDVPPAQSQSRAPWTFYAPAQKKFLSPMITLSESGVLNGDILRLQAQPAFNPKNDADDTLVRSHFKLPEQSSGDEIPSHPKSGTGEKQTGLIGVTWEKEWQF